MTKVFGSVGVALPCSIEKISKGQFQDNYDMLQVSHSFSRCSPSALSQHVLVSLPPQFCYQHAQRIHPSTDLSAHRPSSSRPPHPPALQLTSLPNYSDATASLKAQGRGGRAPQGRNVQWNR